MAASTRHRRAAWAVFAISAAMPVASIPFTIWLSGSLDFGTVGFGLIFLTLPVTGILIARRQPDNRIAWILLAAGAVVGLSSLAEPYVNEGVVLHPGSLPGAAAVAAVNSSTWIPIFGLTGTFLLLLFPDGRLPSPRWRPVAWASAFTIGFFTLVFVFGQTSLEGNPNVANPLGIETLAPLLSVTLAFTPVFPMCMLACAVSLVQRFRRSKGIERQQIKWLASGAAAVASVYLLMMLISAFYNFAGRPSPHWLDNLGNFSVLTFLLIPIAICIAVLRYGLYGIDRLISRTVSYAVITGTLLMVYLLLVTTVSRIAPAGSSLAVAASTLAVAALFQPLRRRVQTAVDRRFNRARYDADRTVESFTRTLRQEVDLDAVKSTLVAAVHDTLQPTDARLWLREPNGSA